MEYPSYFFYITPVVGVDEEAFEKSLVESIISFSLRTLEDLSSTLFKGKDEEGRTRYLLRLKLTLVGGGTMPPGDLTGDLQERVGSDGAVSFVAIVEAEVPTSP
jgi:hypothetical protein